MKYFGSEVIWPLGMLFVGVGLGVAEDQGQGDKK